MLHPSYTDLITTINSETDSEAPVVNSRYSIVLATARRARQLISGGASYVDSYGRKPLSVAVEEVDRGYVTIEPEAEEGEAEGVEEAVAPEVDDITGLEERL